MYLVTIKNDYTNEAQTEQQIIDNLKIAGEVTLRKSRKDNYKFVTVNGHTVARAFATKAAQISYLIKVGILSA